MWRWLLELFGETTERQAPPPDPDLGTLIDERRRLAEILATYREFGFDAQSEGCRNRLRQVQAMIRRIQEGTPASEKGAE